VIRNPEITKKTSTPMKPPVTPGKPAWKQATESMATALRPSISGICLRVGHRQNRVSCPSNSKLEVDELCIAVIKSYKKQKENRVAAGT
jgi:hypothetical protein